MFVLAVIMLPIDTNYPFDWDKALFEVTYFVKENISSWASQ